MKQHYCVNHVPPTVMLALKQAVFHAHHDSICQTVMFVKPAFLIAQNVKMD